MAGYPPQQHYAAVHQPAHERFGAPNYHLPHTYPSHVPNAEHPYHFVNVQAQSQPQLPPRSPKLQPQPALSGNGGNARSSQPQQQQQHSMHQSHAAPPDRIPPYDPHRNHSARPSSQAVAQVPQAGPSLPRQQQYGPNTSAGQHSNQAPHHHSNPAVATGHTHQLPPSAVHSQSQAHSHTHAQHPHASYGPPVHPHDYEQQHAPPGLGGHSGGHRMANQHIPGSGQNGASRKNNGAVREKERDVGATPRSTGGAAKGGASVKRGGQEGKSGAGGKAVGGQAADKASASLHAAANDEPMLESKKIRKRKEVVDRIHRVHWDTLENREILYHDLQHKLSVTSTTLLLWPSNSRPYHMALHRLNLERDAQLRQSALLHAHQVDSARMAYDQETQKVEDEARNSKKLVREKLLAAVEDRRRRLREDKESGEGMSDTLLDSSTRPHATRKLRNKGTSSSKRGGDSDAALAARVAGTSGNGVAMGRNGSLLGLIFGNGAGADGTSTPRRGDANGLLGGLTSMAEFNQLSGVNGPIGALPPSNFDSAANSTVSLLHLQGVGGGMGDSSYMSGTRVALQNQSKGKKKPGGKGSLANVGITTGGAAIGGSAAMNGNAVNASGADDDDDRNTNPRTIAAAAAAAAAAASLAIGTGRLRWEPGKSVGQLTSAKDIEIESDLINIRKTGNKRRRR